MDVATDRTAMHAYNGQKAYFHLKARFKPLSPTSSVPWQHLQALSIATISSVTDG